MCNNFPNIEDIHFPPRFFMLFRHTEKTYIFLCENDEFFIQHTLRVCVCVFVCLSYAIKTKPL